MIPSRFVQRSFVALGCLLTWQAAGAQEAAVVTPQVQRLVEQSINEAALRGHIRFLADDMLEGRGPGSRGDQLTQRYLVTQFETLGFEPSAPGGGWLQQVPLVGVTSVAPASITLSHGADTLTLKGHEDFVVTSGKPTDSSEVRDAEIVFVGYGIVAPEYDWDDYKGVDLRGKVLLMMNNDPADDPQLFAGKRRLYYGRWDYKYAMAARQGAAGAIILHTTESAGYPYQVVQTSWSGEQFELRDKQGPRVEITGWFSDEAGRRVAKLSGHDLDQLRAAAQQRDFRPVPLGTRISIKVRCEVRHKDTANVLALIRGSDAQRSQEMVIYMAHHDHLGMAAARDQRGDNIYNGAVDNASGVACLLAIARAYARLAPRPARSILFACVGAEEQGLLGSAYFADHPPTAAGHLAAVLNIDGINILGPTHDVNMIGYGKSSLDDIVQRVARRQQRVVTPDHFPDRGYYYRSDQFSLAKIGVPGVYLHSGIQVIGKPSGWGRQRREEWIQTRYHQPSDEYSDEWNLGGAVADTRLLFYTGLHVAQQRPLPRWNEGDEFEAARKAALAARPDADSQIQPSP